MDADLLAVCIECIGFEGLPWYFKATKRVTMECISWLSLGQDRLLGLCFGYDQGLSL